MTNILAGGFKHLLFSIIYGIILPIDEFRLFKMVKTTNQYNYGKSPFFMGKFTISMVIFHSYVKLPTSICTQWEFQDPKMEVLYHIRPYFRGISPYIALI